MADNVNGLEQVELLEEKRLRSSSVAVESLVGDSEDTYHDPLEVLTKGVAACDDSLPSAIPVVGRFVYPAQGKTKPHVKRLYLAVVPSHNISAYVRREQPGLDTNTLFFDPPLTSYGGAQAVLMGRRLTNVRIDKVYCSPQQRSLHFANLMLAARASSISRVLSRPCFGVLRPSLVKKKLACDDIYPDVYSNIYTESAIDHDITSEHFHPSILKVKVAANMICDVLTGSIGSCTVEEANITPMQHNVGTKKKEKQFSIATARTIESYSSMRQRTKRQPLRRTQTESFWGDETYTDDEDRDSSSARESSTLLRKSQNSLGVAEEDEEDEIFYHNPEQSPIDTILSSYLCSLHRASLSPQLRFSTDALQEYVGSQHSILTARDINVCNPKLEEVRDVETKRNTLGIYVLPELNEQVVGPASIGSKSETLFKTWYSCVFYSTMKQQTWWWFPGRELVAYDEVREQVEKRWNKFLMELHMCVSHVIGYQVDIELLKKTLQHYDRKVMPLPPPPAPPSLHNLSSHGGDSPLGITYGRNPGKFVLYSTEPKKRNPKTNSCSVMGSNVFTWEDTDIEGPQESQTHTNHNTHVVKQHLDEEDDELKTLCSSEAPDSPSSTASFIEDVRELTRQNETFHILQKSGTTSANSTVQPMLPPLPVLKLPSIVLQNTNTTSNTSTHNDGQKIPMKPLGMLPITSYTTNNTANNNTPLLKPMLPAILPIVPSLPTFHSFAKPITGNHTNSLLHFTRIGQSTPVISPATSSMPTLDISPLISANSSATVTSPTSEGGVKLQKSPLSVMIAPEPPTPLLYTTIVDEKKQEDIIHHLDVSEYEDEDEDDEYEDEDESFHFLPSPPDTPMENVMSIEEALDQVLQDSTATTYSCSEDLLHETLQNLLKSEKTITTEEFLQYTRSYKHSRKVHRDNAHRQQEYVHQKQEWTQYQQTKSGPPPTGVLPAFPPAGAPVEPQKHTIHRVDKLLDTIARSSDLSVLVSVHPIWTKLLLAKWCLQGDYVPDIHGGELLCIEMIVE